nr:MAG TPA: hypothetical protein [Caudoviricetes sp.]
MAEQTSVIKKLKDANGNIVYPQSLTKAIYDESGNRLDAVLKELSESSHQQTISSSTQPENQSSGDVWIKEL